MEYSFAAPVWVWSGTPAWHFASVPEDIADDIEARTRGTARGFGSVRVEASSQRVTWRTSLFPDSKSGTYLLPVKKQVRQQLGCEEGSLIDLTLRLIEE